MTLYSVFGSPILHSKSPQLFKNFLYEGDFYLRIRPQSAADLLFIVKKLDIKGASITSPFKEDLFFLLDEITEEAAAIGAVNCIRYEGEKVFGHNTDCFGVTASLQESGLDLCGSRILVLGAGGAAKAAIYGLIKAGSEVYVSNRTAHKAESLANNFGAIFVNWENPGRLPYFDAVVSTVLPGAIPPFAGYIASRCLLDAVYKPSKMKSHCNSRGMKIIPGERWLIYQGIAASSFYLGIQTPFSLNILDSIDFRGFKTKYSSKTGLLSYIDKIENGIHKDSIREEPRIFILNDESIQNFSPDEFDLLVSGFGVSERAIQRVINEEMHQAFGSVRSG